MYLEIVSPEATLFAGEVTSVTVPGINGEFQMLTNHAPIVSLLQEGDVKVQGTIEIEDEFQNKFSQGPNGETVLSITSGTVEMKDNIVRVKAMGMNTIRFYLHYLFFEDDSNPYTSSRRIPITRQW